MSARPSVEISPSVRPMTVSRTAFTTVSTSFSRIVSAGADGTDGGRAGGAGGGGGDGEADGGGDGETDGGGDGGTGGDGEAGGGGVGEADGGGDGEADGGGDGEADGGSDGWGDGGCGIKGGAFSHIIDAVTTPSSWVPSGDTNCHFSTHVSIFALTTEKRENWPGVVAGSDEPSVSKISTNAFPLPNSV